MVEVREMESVLAARLRRPQIAAPRGLRLRATPRWRALLAALLVTLLLGGGFMLFRDSSFVAVQQVQIVGVRGPQSAAVSEALESAARQMSTMDYSAGGLQAAVAKYPIVRSVAVRTSFPHKMWIDVSEQPPVAQLADAGQRSAVAANGVVLGASFVSGALPTISAHAIPSVGAKVHEAQLRSYLTVLGATPAPLLPLVSGVFVGQQGLTVKMANGLLIYFGDDSRPHAKWDALVTVLTSPGTSGASYVDVRLPERPAAKVQSGGVGSGESEQVSASDPTSAALAASLARAVNGESSTSTGTSSTEPGSSLSSGSNPSSTSGGALESEPTSSAAGGSEASTTEGTGATAEGG